LSDPEVRRTFQVRAPRPPHGSRTIEVVVGGPIGPTDVPEIWERVRVLLEVCDAEVVVCDVAALADPDAVTVDALARLQLAAGRYGHRIRLLRACAELRDLLDLTGLADVVPCVEGLSLEPIGQAEEREPARGVEEEGDAGDPVA
jgi:ABC-type transporter Mla MlaB component